MALQAENQSRDEDTTVHFTNGHQESCRMLFALVYLNHTDERC
jgi:hypothetical protein